MTDSPQLTLKLAKDIHSSYSTLQGLQGVQGFATTQGLQGLHGFATAQGLHGLQGFAAAHGLQGIQEGFAAHAVQVAICTEGSAALTWAVGKTTAEVARLATLRAKTVFLSMESSPLDLLAQTAKSACKDND